MSGRRWLAAAVLVASVWLVATRPERPLLFGPRPPEDMVYLPAGWFTVGCPEGRLDLQAAIWSARPELESEIRDVDQLESECKVRPPQRVFLPSMLIDRRAVRAYSSNLFKTESEDPDDAARWCWMRGGRLPTFVEWERALRSPHGPAYEPALTHEDSLPLGRYTGFRWFGRQMVVRPVAHGLLDTAAKTLLADGEGAWDVVVLDWQGTRRRWQACAGRDGCEPLATFGFADRMSADLAHPAFRCVRVIGRERPSAAAIAANQAIEDRLVERWAKDFHIEGWNDEALR